MNIKTINSRIRRGDMSSSTRQFLSRAEQLGMTTPSGFIRTGKIINDPLFQKALEEYEQNFFEEKTDEYFDIKQDILSLLMEYVTPSEIYQEMRKANNENTFAHSIADKIAEFDIFEEDYREEILDYLRDMWY